MTQAARKRKPAPALDLDAIKRAGLNSEAESRRLLREHKLRQEQELALELQRKQREEG